MSEHFGKKEIWRVFWVLLGITMLEFLVALGFPEVAGDDQGFIPLVIPKVIKNALYGIMTILKAFYIVAYFMHLKFERLNMIYSILLPIIFIIAIIAALIYEAGYWLDVRPAVESMLHTYK